MKKVKQQTFCISLALLLALLTFAVIPVNVSKAQEISNFTTPEISTTDIQDNENIYSQVNKATSQNLDIRTAAVTQKRVVLASGTKYATNMYVIRSGKPGPVVMIVGGVHGNEPAGYKAASKVKDYTIKSGTLIVIPKANKLAVEQHRRAAKGNSDLNRSFPGDTIIARAIYSAVKKYDVDWLMDMHEGYDYSINKSSDSVGQSLIYYPRGNTKTIALSILSTVNKPISSNYREFHLLRLPISGSLARSIGQYLGVHSFIFETCSKESLTTRVNNQLKAANTLLNKLDMK